MEYSLISSCCGIMIKVENITELKTLDNMDPEACCHGINKRELKQEAIKDIKHLQSSESHTDFAADCEAMGNGTKYNVIEYIIWKFNLTVEDLKCV